ncbi:MAG TPA: hypothetical protein VMD28_09645 [Acidimicrobiales bacterium]|nr:hypothetical protein [Acidimicrobiales bacterium]
MPLDVDRVELPEGRRIDLRDSGAEEWLPVFHHGTPGAGSPIRALECAAHERGLRVVADTEAVLRALGDATRCVVAGWSGGGPHTLACAARLPGAAAPLDWMSAWATRTSTGSAPRKWPARLRALLNGEREQLRDTSAGQVVDLLPTVLPDVDRAVLTTGSAVTSSRASETACARGWTTG